MVGSTPGRTQSQTWHPMPLRTPRRQSRRRKGSARALPTGDSQTQREQRRGRDGQHDGKKGRRGFGPPRAPAEEVGEHKSGGKRGGRKAGEQGGARAGAAPPHHRPDAPSRGTEGGGGTQRPPPERADRAPRRDKTRRK